MKVTRTVTLDADLITELKARKVNVSKTANDLLKQHVGILQEENPDETLEDKITNAKARLISLETKKKEIKEKENKRIEDLKKKGQYIDLGFMGSGLTEEEYKRRYPNG